MITVVGVRFKAAGKIYYFDPEKLDLDIGDCVIVETARGWNTEKSPRRPARSVKKSVVQPLKKVIRIADEQDTVKHEENLKKKQSALDICQKKSTPEVWR